MEQKKYMQNVMGRMEAEGTQQKIERFQANQKLPYDHGKALKKMTFAA